MFIKFTHKVMVYVLFHINHYKQIVIKYPSRYNSYWTLLYPTFSRECLLPLSVEDFFSFFRPSYQKLFPKVVQQVFSFSRWQQHSAAFHILLPPTRVEAEDDGFFLFQESSLLFQENVRQWKIPKQALLFIPLKCIASLALT